MADTKRDVLYDTSLRDMEHIAREATLLRNKDYRGMGRVPPRSFTVGDVRCVLEAARALLPETGDGT